MASREITFADTCIEDIMRRMTFLLWSRIDAEALTSRRPTEERSKCADALQTLARLAQTSKAYYQVMSQTHQIKAVRLLTLFYSETLRQTTHGMYRVLTVLGSTEDERVLPLRLLLSTGVLSMNTMVAGKTMFHWAIEGDNFQCALTLLRVRAQQEQNGPETPLTTFLDFHRAVWAHAYKVLTHCFEYFPNPCVDCASTHSRINLVLRIKNKGLVDRFLDRITFCEHCPSQYLHGISDAYAVKRVFKITGRAPNRVNDPFALVMDAARDGNHALLSYYLKSGVSPHPPPGPRYGPDPCPSAILFCTRMLTRATLRVLLKAGVDIEGVNHEGNTALEQAVKSQLVYNVRSLLENGAKITQHAEYEALKCDTAHVLKMLTKFGATWGMAQPYEGGKTALHMAVHVGTGYTAVLIKALKKRGTQFDIDARDASGKTPLMQAVLTDKVESVHVLIAHGADTSVTFQDGETLFFRAVKLRNTQIAEALAKADASVANSVDPSGETALYAAVYRGLWRTAYRLLKLGTAPDTLCVSPGRARETALHAAVHREDVTMVNILLDDGADPNARDSARRPPMAYLGKIVARPPKARGTKRAGANAHQKHASYDILCKLVAKGATKPCKPLHLYFDTDDDTSLDAVRALWGGRAKRKSNSNQENKHQQTKRRRK